MKTRRRLLVLAALLLAFVNVWFAVDYLAQFSSADSSETLDVRPPITRLEPIAVYPRATRINLLINDRFDATKGEYASKPLGTNLTSVQRGELANSVKKVVVVKPAGKDYGEAVAACFIPHHFFRFFDIRGEKMGEIEVCFCCKGARLEPSLADQSIIVEVDAIERLVKQMKLPTDVGC